MNFKIQSKTLYLVDGSLIKVKIEVSFTLMTTNRCLERKISDSPLLTAFHACVAFENCRDTGEMKPGTIIPIKMYFLSMWRFFFQEPKNLKARNSLTETQNKI